MVRVVLLDSGRELDVEGRITYNKQIGDIGDVTKINASYSRSLTFPKTLRNVQELNNLGLRGDTSDSPYIKIRVNVLDNGISVVQNGLLSVRETSKTYKAYIQDGIIDFFKEVSVDKISEVIDLTDLTHQSTVSNIIDSFDNDTYRYVIANFNGPPSPNINGVTNLTPAALVPSINIEYLFDAIMDHYGWSYSGDIDLAFLWMSYPNSANLGTNEGVEPVLDMFPLTIQYNGNNIVTALGPRLFYQMNGSFDFDFINTIPLGGLNNASFRIQQPGNYRITFQFNGASVGVVPPGVGVQIEGVEVYLWRNAAPTEFFTILDEDETITVDLTLFENEIIAFGTELAIPPLNSQSVTIASGNFDIELLGTQEVDFTEALIEVQVKSFFKEILTRQALMPFIDIDHRNIHFLSVDSRLNAEVVDWTDKYVKRTKERYVYDSYARNNNLKHKYDDDDQDFNDGRLVVENANLADEKTIYDSFTHSPLEDFVTYQGENFPEYQVNNFKMFEVETSTDADTGDVLAEYKPIKNRFYIFSSETRNDTLYILGNPVFSFPIAVLGGNTFRDIVPMKYSELNVILDKTRVHDIELALTKWDVALANLAHRYYFAQEAAYYLLNRLRWREGRTCMGEFVKMLGGTVNNVVPDDDTDDPVLLSPFNISSVPRATALEICSEEDPLDRVLYHDGNLASVSVGDFVFNDEQGNSPLLGLSVYYKIVFDRPVLISSEGEVLEITNCN